mgnify:CR=1 FL=1
MSPHRFEELVSDALDLIPGPLAAAIDNVVVLVEDRHPDEPDLLGLYEGVALTERDSGIDLREAGGGWRLYTRARFAPYVERLLLDARRS